MFTIKNLFLRAMLALSIALGAPAALAGPIYHVSIDTSGLTGTGFLELALGGIATSGGAAANVSNFNGAFGAADDRLGEVSGNIIDGVRIGNRELDNLFDQAVTLGGLFSFDVSFDLPLAGDGSTFRVSLLNDFFFPLTSETSLLHIDISAIEPTVVSLFEPAMAGVAEVPEPADWLLLATGLMLIAMTRRMQQRR